MITENVLIIACSKQKTDSTSPLPALDLYDGPAYRILRKQLNDSKSRPTILVISAKHGLLFADSFIYPYNKRMTKERAQELKPEVESFIRYFIPPSRYKNIFIWAGKTYLDAFPTSLLKRSNTYIADGPIGLKLHILKEWCLEWQRNGKDSNTANIKILSHTQANSASKSYLKYYIPDWDDYLDKDYDFDNDKFSWEPNNRPRLYAHQLFGKKPLYDGIIVSLGHIIMGKGFIRNGLNSEKSIHSGRRYLHLRRGQLLMGDCGAFSYRRFVEPPYTTKQVIKLYNSLKVDIGASIDHIPFGEVKEHGGLRPLNATDIENRIELTTKLAQEFLVASKNGAKFEPMGVIQARSAEEYASIAKQYVKSGYRYIALGGLVSKRDDNILAIAEATVSELERSFPLTYQSVNIHLFGVLRDNLLSRLNELRITSFDSGSYLRKAWLRSDKNYLSTNNVWYSAIRIPYSNDKRFQKNAIEKGISVSQLQQLEHECLRLLRAYEKQHDSITKILDKIIEYDSILLRTSDTNDLRAKYERTLKDAPWELCECPVCLSLGIDVVIFRGFNRNKRRGFHNTRIFYKQLEKVRG